jgi:hypothetical protein
MEYIKSIIISEPSWKTIRTRIVEDYGSATVMISWRLRNTLGFTVRNHHDYINESLEWYEKNTIHLDFYDEQLKTLFLLKYGELLERVSPKYIA